MGEIEIRATAPEEYRMAVGVVAAALMHAPPSDEDWGKSHVAPSWEQSDSLSAWDGGRCVGHVAGFRFDTLVPGGAWLPTSGVTRVGVLSTHRRRGLLRQMLNRLLAEAAGRGQVLASLRASETPIYTRFGFGLAGQCAEATIVPANALPIHGRAVGGSMRILRPDEILATLPPIYERAATRPGVLRRPEWMWQRYFATAIELGGDAEYVAVHTSADGVDDGFVHYKVEWKEERLSAPKGAGEVFELWGADSSVELALWDYICNIDLVREWFAEERPVDDLIQYAVRDTRSYASHPFDEQWLRLLDVDTTLAKRTYAEAEGAFTLAVVDGLLPANNGAWEISAAGAKRTDNPDADLVADVRELSAAYLGGTKWSKLAAAGRVEVNDAAALRRADALFAVPDAPYSCSGF